MSINRVIDNLGPDLILNSLIRAEAFQAQDRDSQGNSAYFHPGDIIGSLIGQLSECAEKDFPASIVAVYIAQTRDHAPNSPADGKRVTLDAFLASLPNTIDQDSADQTGGDTENIQDFLNPEVPFRCSHNPALIDEA